MDQILLRELVLASPEILTIIADNEITERIIIAWVFADPEVSCADPEFVDAEVEFDWILQAPVVETL